MESINISNQTLNSFINNPFGKDNKQKHLAYEDKYQSYKRSNKIKVEGSLEIDGNYFIHVKVPSESQKDDVKYDVIIQFFTTNEKVKRRLSVEHYYVQFFSNSPGFLYKYAALYKLEGYLIESLADKFQDGVLDVLPDKANSSYELFYDSTIYYASRYLLDNKLTYLGKLTLKILSKKNAKKFFGDVQDFETIGISTDIHKLEASIKKEISKDNKLSREQEVKLRKKNPTIGTQIFIKNQVKHAKKSTVNDSNGPKIISASKHTSGGRAIKKVTTKTKKRSSHSTRHK